MTKKSKTQLEEISANLERLSERAENKSAVPEAFPPMKKTGEGIAPEDLIAIQKAKHKLGFTALRAQNAILESQMAELEQKNLTFSLFLKYRLTEQDQINDQTGEIIKK